MAITDTFRNAVKEGKIVDIRIMMKNSLFIDRTFHEYQKMEELVKKTHGLYDVHDGTKLEYDRTKWNDEYLNLLSVQLIDNFSHERINHIKQVIQYLHPVKIEASIDTETENNRNYGEIGHPLSYKEQKKKDQQEGRIIKIVSGATVGGVAGGMISGVAGGSVIAGAVVGAVVVGGVVVLATKKK